MNIFLLLCSAPEDAVVAWGRGARAALTQTWTPTQWSAASQSADPSLWRHATRSPAPDRKVPQTRVPQFSVFVASLNSCAHLFAFSAAVPSRQDPRGRGKTFKGYRPYVPSEPSGTRSKVAPFLSSSLDFHTFKIILRYSKYPANCNHTQIYHLVV